MSLELSLNEVLLRTLASAPDEASPLDKYLEMPPWDRADPAKRAMQLTRALREAGSNDIATMFRGGEGVEYAEVVFDVGKRLRAAVKQSSNASSNEAAILVKLFEDAFDRMDSNEKAILIQHLQLDTSHLGVALPVGAIAVKLALEQFGGFAIYRSSVIVANVIARALLGRGLTLAANATLTRSLGLLLGPIGWAATGLWLAADIASPAYRKTIPSVVHVAYLRQRILREVTIGVVGDGSTGKDAAVGALFGINTGRVDPIAGSTSEVVQYAIGKRTAGMQVVNFPGFNDIRPSVNSHVDENLGRVDVFLALVDLNRGCSATDVAIVNKVRSQNRKFFVCLNKKDSIKPQSLERLRQKVVERLQLQDGEYALCAFDPTHGERTGIEEVRHWLKEELLRRGKAEEAVIAALTPAES